ncbi:MAG: glycosyltransferase [Chryseolinea sp.]
MTIEIMAGTTAHLPSGSPLDFVQNAKPVPTKTMNIVFLTHPEFLGHVSLPRFAGMLFDGMRERGHKVQYLSPKARFVNLTKSKVAKKWLGYIDQYLIFPGEVKRSLKNYPSDTLFVFTDNALGPWVPLLAHRPHVIHCHDFMAQQSALGMIVENPTRWSGRKYQKMIVDGYCKGRNFISGSENTRKVLQKFISCDTLRSELVYNGLHQSFEQFDPGISRAVVGKEFGLELSKGYLLHVGGNQWYKNRTGVIEMYDSWRSRTEMTLPLVLVGLPPTAEIMKTYSSSAYKTDIHFVTNAKDRIMNLTYSGASVFLFPSKAEGFGWPAAEAMASGCPVITTNEAPMTEVAGTAGFLIPKKPHQQSLTAAWAQEAGAMIEKVLTMSYAERQSVIDAGLANAKRFDTDKALDRIESIYLDIVRS